MSHWEAWMTMQCQGARHCTNHAKFIVRIHAIHKCRNNWLLDQGGNTIHFMCQACADAAAWRIGEMIGEMYAEMPDTSEPIEAHCDTCGRRIMELHDIFTVEHLLPVKDRQ